LQNEERVAGIADAEQGGGQQVLPIGLGKLPRSKAFGLEGIGDNVGAFLGPLIAVALLFALGLNIRWIFYLAIVPGLCSIPSYRSSSRKH
jgi:MFS family permease